MAWIILIVAGLLEAVWASLLPSTHGLTRPWPTAGFLVALAASMWGLAHATRTIPISTGYAAWTGIGILGAVIAGLLFYGESLSAARGGFLVLLVVAIVGLRITTPA